MMVFKLMENAQKRWRGLKAYERLAEVIDLEIVFEDGVKKEAA